MRQTSHANDFVNAKSHEGNLSFRVHCIDLQTKEFSPITRFACLEICSVLGHFSFSRNLAVWCLLLSLKQGSRSETNGLLQPCTSKCQIVLLFYGHYVSFTLTYFIKYSVIFYNLS